MSQKTILKLKRIGIIAGVLALIVIAYYLYSIIRFVSNIQDDPLTTTYSSKNPPPKWDGKERVNILLLGADTRGMRKSEVPRSDMMLVVSMDPQTKSAAMFSVMRDTFVKIPGYQKNRINTAMSLGGPELAMETVSELTDLPIQYYVSTDFDGFISLVDTLGGIDIDVEKNMTYSDRADNGIYDIKLKKGLQTLDGKKALQYVRFRHDATSDFTRTERQRKFVSALAQELQTNTSIFRLPSILRSIEPYIKTNLTFRDMTKLAVLAHEFNSSKIPGMQIPPNELISDVRVNGAAVLTVDPLQLHPVVRKFLEQSAGSANAQKKTETDQES
jgi:LCP family protein required for cell wall assembly